MNKITCLFVLALTVSLRAAAGPAAEPAPLLLQRASEIMNGSRGLASSRVVTEIKVYDGTEKFLGAMTSVDVVSSWAKQPPVWVNVSKKTESSPGFTMELNLHLEEDPEKLFEGYGSWTLRKQDRLEATSVEIWDGMRMGQADSRAVAYIDPITAKPHRVDFEFPVRSTFGTRVLKVAVLLGTGADGAWLPLSAVIDQTGRVMVWRRHVLVTKTYQDWVRKPQL